MLRRSIGLFSPNRSRVDAGDNTTGTDSDVPLNDDKAERLRRKQDKVLELNQKNSPLRNNDRKLSFQPDGRTLSNSQIAEQYAICLKLSSENKITMKNAFTLQLIDLMTDIVKKPGSEMTNFQVASCTLDASTKIYACRVDCVHAETFRMATGLSRTGEGKGEKRGEDEDSDNGDEDPNVGKKPKKKKFRGSTIEQNVKALSMNKVDLKFEVDPLFQKTSELFTDGGASGGILLNFLRCQSDGCKLIMDSTTVLESLPAETLSERSWKVNLSQYKPDYEKLMLEMPKICPAIADFEFGSWIPGENNKLNISISNSLNGGAAEDDDDSNDHDGGVGFDNDGENNVDVSGVESTSSREAGVASLNGNSPSRGSSDSSATNPCSDVASLVRALATEPSEYSYFDAGLLGAWAGPHHWRIRPRPQEKTTEEGRPAKEPKKRTKKLPFEINFAAQVNFARHFRSPRSDVYLSANTLKQRSEDATTLPEDLHYKAVNLIQLFLRPSLLMHLRKCREAAGSPDCDLSDYNYDNANDVENFVPAQAEVNGDDCSPYTPAFAQTMAVLTPATSQHDDNGEIGSQGGHSSMAFAGDNLVQQPYKVAKFDVAIARSAKQINVKRLKRSMWKLLTRSDADAVREEEENGRASFVEGRRSFVELYEEMPASVNAQMAKDLSKHIAFVCLLHLANEKNLELVPEEDLKDFGICQAVQPGLS